MGLGAWRGKRLYASAPQSHWHTTTMICAMHLDGSTACMTTAKQLKTIAQAF